MGHIEMREIMNKRKLTIAMIGQKKVPSRNGGIERVLTMLTPILVSDGYNVTCLNRDFNDIDNEYDGKLKNNTFRGVHLRKVFTIKKGGLAASSSSFFATLLATFNKNIDVIHFHAEGPSLWIWIPKLFRKKCIVTIHGLDWKRDKWKNNIGAIYIKLAERILSRYADEIIVLNKSTQEYFKRKYNRNTHIIPNGINKPEKSKGKHYLNKFNLDENEYFLSVSRITREKQLHLLINAYNHLNTNKKLVIVGGFNDSPNYSKKLFKLVHNNKNIIFTDFLSGEALNELFTNAYCYVIPSKIEGMSMSLLEAMAYGNCVLGSDIEEIKSVIEDKGVLFKNGDQNDLQKKMQFLCNNPKVVRKYASISSSYILALYNWQDIAKLTEKLYE